MEGGIKPSPVNMSRIGDRRVRQHLKAAKLHTCDLTSGITRAQRLLPESHFVVQLRIAVWTGNARDTRPQPDVGRPTRELWYPPSNAMGRFNEAADSQMPLVARAGRPPVLRLHTELRI